MFVSNCINFRNLLTNDHKYLGNRNFLISIFDYYRFIGSHLLVNNLYLGTCVIHILLLVYVASV